ncbi:MAG: 5-methyltetrahydropteroyltriglutamate--homocysteine S-methyltransferase [Candidatus Auribacterota bacterium]|jgi:5-methyltetrahydropteroyltriglutamate--homocysteine methyltransferase|nr:5-methyltetrahydropteroyltriglutamate--homocysteine S-methyltransferase [Candidatus Auribacterota bacterium]
MNIKTTYYGFPKIGPNRELKRALEAYWKGSITRKELFTEAETVAFDRMKAGLDAGMDVIPSNDFSLYDFMLDTSTMFGVIPKRFAGIDDTLDRYFAMARGSDTAIACEMTKWFDTNYHYIVPELSGTFKLDKNRPLYSFKFAKKQLGIVTRPVLVGPFTFVSLSKFEQIDTQGDNKPVKVWESDRFADIVYSLAGEYNRLLKELEAEGVQCVQFEEPSFVMDLTETDVSVILQAYKKMTANLSTLRVAVNTCYESISHYRDLVFGLPVAAIGLDFVSNEENLKYIEEFGFPANKKLIAGVVSGRDPWKTDIAKTVDLAKFLAGCVGESNLVMTNAGPLFHLPYTLKAERGHLDDNVMELLSFARERLEELKLIQEVLSGNKSVPHSQVDDIRKSFANQDVQKRVADIDESKISRHHPFSERYKKQCELLKLPMFPTTTIGSFPQTAEVRKIRAAYKSGKISFCEYDLFIKNSIDEVVKLQEDLDIDVLVHGEFERTDMVEYFGEKMIGFAFTKNGWVQSYGSRCVRPPIIYGDVSRPEPMTVDYTVYAQSLTGRPVKGMLTGPITIVNWSFYRRDITKKEVVYQVAMALKDEVRDLEQAGISIIQIDEPAFREGLPLKKSKQEQYINYAVNSFKLTNMDVAISTQVHTHMCYSEFNELIQAIYAMDSDVISMEASRSRGEVMGAFEHFDYDHGIGLGVYDIHSPRIPTVEEMIDVVRRAVRVIDVSLFWINPDCGLKTRGYEETIAALRNMVQAAYEMRKTTAS